MAQCVPRTVLLTAVTIQHISGKVKGKN